MRMRGLLSVMAAAGLAGSLPAVEEAFCDPATLGEVCTESTLSIRFVDTGTSEIRGVRPGDEVRAVVTIDVKEAGISGFSYGVKHDPAVLSIPQPAPGNPTCDFDLGDLSGCNPTYVGTGMRCSDEDGFFYDCMPVMAQGGSGFFSAIIVSLQKKRELPLGAVDLPLAFVTYKVTADPGPDGTKLSFTDELNPPGSPPVTVHLTVQGKSRRPRVVNDAVIYGGGDAPRFSRADANGAGGAGIADVVVIADNLFVGEHVFFDCPEMLDANDDGALNVADPIALAAYLFQAGPPPPMPFRSCDEDPTPDILGCPQPNCR